MISLQTLQNNIVKSFDDEQQVDGNIHDTKAILLGIEATLANFRELVEKVQGQQTASTINNNADNIYVSEAELKYHNLEIYGIEEN